MWKVLQAPYLMTFTVEGNNFYNVGVTDFRKYWMNNISAKTFLAHMKESNDGLEFDDENVLLERGIDMISDPQKLRKVKISQEDDGKILSVSLSKMYEITLTLDLRLLEASPDFFAAITQPLLKAVQDLRKSEQELRSQIIKKEKLIKEYKEERITSSRYATTIYNDDDHMKRHGTYDKYFSGPNVSEVLETVASSSDSTGSNNISRKRQHSPEPKATNIELNPKQETVAKESIPQVKKESLPETKEVKPVKQKKHLKF